MLELWEIITLMVLLIFILILVYLIIGYLFFPGTDIGDLANPN